MNVQKDQIQALITEIDEVLSQPNLRLPWVVFGETVTRSRQVLERVRKYLVFLQQQVDEGSLLPPMETNQPLSSTGMREPLWQAIRREMIYLRNHLTQPLQDEVDRLRTEHRNLVQEIQQLEARKAQATGQIQPQSYQQQLSREFLQEFMTRLQDSLIHNVTETLNHIENRFLDSIVLTETKTLPALTANSSDSSPTSVSSLTPAQRLEQMRQLQVQSDHLLMTLDSSLSVIFEALQRNLQTYSDSLSQSLERMHSLGKQGEVMLTTLVNQLAQQVGQETSSYLQSSLQLTESETPVNPVVPPTPEPTTSPPPSPLEDLSLTVEELLPYAGAELPRQSFVSFPPHQTREDTSEELKITDEPQGQSPFREEDELELIPEEPAFSLNLDEPVLEQSQSDVDAEFEMLFAIAEEQQTPVTPAVEEAEIDLFGEAAESIQTIDEDEGSEEVDTLLLDEDTTTNVETSTSVKNESSVSLAEEDLFGNIASTTTEPIEVENIESESLGNASDLFNEPDSNAPPEIDSVSLVAEDLFLEEKESLSPLASELTKASAASDANPFEETLADLSDIFEEPTFEEVSSPGSDVVSVRTQKMLTSTSSEAVSSSSNIENNNTLNWETDEYIQASPDENLLPINLEADSDQVDSRLLIDRNTLEHLEADLFNLEKPGTRSPTQRSVGKSTNAPAQSTSQKPKQQAVPKPSSAEEVITFEDLFKDIGMEPRSAQSVPSLSIESVETSPVETQNSASLQTFSDLTLDEVLNSFNLAEEQPLRLDTEQEQDSLSLEALSQEFS